MATNNMTDGQLDITDIENEDLDQLAQQIETFYKQDGAVKARLAYHWERNHKFLDGDQWVVFSGDRDTGGVWQRLTVSKNNEYIPRPVTNYIFDAYQTLKSYLIKNKPRSTVRPNTRAQKDKDAAKIADLVLETNWERLREADNYEYAASCLLTYGTVFKKSYWDTSSLQMAKVPRMEMQPSIDPMTGQAMGEHEVQAVDPLTGDPLFDEMPIGDVNTDIVEPQRIALDPLANDLHKIRWIMEYSIQPLSWIKETYAREADGYTGLVDTVKEETALSGSMDRFHALKNSSGVKNKGFEGGGSDGSRVLNSAVVKEYYERPCRKYPKGRMVVVANGVTLYAGESPYNGPDLGDWHPYSACRWEIVPGRFWGKSPLDSGCEIQKQINSIDAVIVLTRKTMAIPQKFIPAGSGIAPGSWTGRPGQEIHGRAVDGLIPSTIPAQGVDGSVFAEREQRVDDMKTVMGNMDILKGDRPPGVTAASALNLLYEVGTGKHYPSLDRWKLFVESDQKKQLKIVSRYYKEPREDFIRMLKAKNSELSEDSISKFIGSDLYDNCNVIVEAGSNIPKLQAAKQAALQEAAQAGVLGLEQPQNRAEYQRQMGITGFDNDIGPDQKRAEWICSLLDGVELNPDNAQYAMPLDVDNSDIHIDVLSRRMKEPSWMEASQAVQQAYMTYYKQVTEMKMEKEQAAQEQAMAAQMSGSAPPQQPNQGALGPQPLKSAGKGATSEMKNAMATDAMVPGSPR
jgi:hypothetical protein